MQFSVFNHRNGELEERSITVKGYPLQNKNIDSIKNFVKYYGNYEDAFMDAINVGDYNAIEKFIGYNELAWGDLSNLLAEDNNIEEYAYRFFMFGITNPELIKLSNLEYVNYKYINDKYMRYLLYNKEDIAFNILLNFLDEYFPNTKYVDTNNLYVFIDSILEGTSYNIKQIPHIIYNGIRSDDTYDNLKDYLLNTKLDYYLEELDYAPYYISTDYNTYVYKDGKIIASKVIIEKFDYSRFIDAINNKISLESIVRVLGNDKQRWRDITKLLLTYSLSKTYIRANKDAIIKMTKDDNFVVTDDMLSYNGSNNFINCIMINVERKAVSKVLSNNINEYVYAYLISSVFQDVFGTYWNEEYSNLLKVREQNPMLNYGSGNKLEYKLYFKEIIHIMSLEHYALNKNLKMYNKFEEYYDSVRRQLNNKLNLPRYNREILLDLAMQLRH